MTQCRFVTVTVIWVQLDAINLRI